MDVKPEMKPANKPVVKKDDRILVSRGDLSLMVHYLSTYRDHSAMLLDTLMARIQETANKKPEEPVA